MHPPANLRAFIAYEPPPDGQAMRAPRPRAALAAVRRFLEACTVPDAAPGRVALSIAERSPLWGADHAPEAMLADAISRFGVAERRPLVRGPSDAAPLGFAHAWTLPHASLDDVADVLAEHTAGPRGAIAAARASVAWRVLLIDPATGVPLPRQGAAHGIGGIAPVSRVTLSLAERSRATLALRYPFERPDEAFLALVAAQRPYVPVTMTWSRFRRLTGRPDGTRATVRKLPPQLFDGL